MQLPQNQSGYRNGPARYNACSQADIPLYGFTNVLTSSISRTFNQYHMHTIIVPYSPPNEKKDTTNDSCEEAGLNRDVDRYAPHIRS